MIRKTFVAAALLIPTLGAASENGMGRDIVLNGTANGALACATCHGADGAGQAGAGFPRLAGLNREYLVKQLGDFQSGARQNPIMGPIAQSLSAEEMAAVADYFSGLNTPVETNQTDAALVAQGERLAAHGNWDAGVPACFRCHGADGTGVAPHFPPLAGQHGDYIAAQLSAWKAGARANDPMNLMGNIARGLSEQDIVAVAAYLSGLQTGDKTHVE